MRVHESQEPRVLGRALGGEGSEAHDATGSPRAPAGFGIRSRGRVVQSIGLRLVAPDVRCAEKKVR